MTTQELIKRIEAYSESTGLALATVGLLATGNARLHKRLVRHADLVDDYSKRLEEFIKENPAPNRKKGRGPA